MSEQQTIVARPGGAQTRTKLSIVSDYLPGFTNACRKAPDRIYVDAFAGCGKGIDPRSGLLYDGSAALSLGVEPPFTEIHLIEQNTERVGELEQLCASHPNATVTPGDANIVIPQILAGM